MFSLEPGDSRCGILADFDRTAAFQMGLFALSPASTIILCRYSSARLLVLLLLPSSVFIILLATLLRYDRTFLRGSYVQSRAIDQPRDL
mmetsp:Transcript_184/g.387  ORF Transcript_184/g.387 Transcript_184/m.387 type:complete len:89 (-) Transcript_184:144-410(-)